MPVAARKRQPSSPHADRIHGPRRPVAPGPIRKSSTSATAQALPTLAPDAVAPDVVNRYLPHYNDQADESYLEARTKARAARRRARRSHRPFRLSWQASVAGCVLLGQLVALLYLQGMALSARNNSYKLDKEIAQVYGNVTHTQKEIAALDSSPRIAQWAQERGWKVATQDKLDSITNRAPLTQETASTDTPSGDAPADGAAGAAKAVSLGHKAHKKHKDAPVRVEIDVDKGQNDQVGSPVDATTAAHHSAADSTADKAATASVARHENTTDDSVPDDNTSDNHSTHDNTSSAASAGGDER